MLVWGDAGGSAGGFGCRMGFYAPASILQRICAGGAMGRCRICRAAIALGVGSRVLPLTAAE